MRDFVFVKEGFVVWATLGYHPIIKTFPSLFTARPKAGFIICYTIVLLCMLYYYTAICGIRVVDKFKPVTYFWRFQNKILQK